MIKLITSETSEFKDDLWNLFVIYQKELIAVSGENWNIGTKEEFYFQGNKYSGIINYLVLDDEEVIGLVCVQNIYYEKPKMLYISQMYIKPEFRRRGYGTKVLSLLKDLFIDKKTVCWLYVLKGNKQGLEFWQKAIKANNLRPTEDDRCYIKTCEDEIKLIFKK